MEHISFFLPQEAIDNQLKVLAETYEKFGSINLQNSPVTEKGLSYLSKIDIDTIDFSGNRNIKTIYGMIDEIVKIKTLKKLGLLKAMHRGDEPLDLEKLAPLQQLGTLLIGGGGYGKEVFTNIAALKKMEKLKKLIIVGRDFNKEGLKDLSELKKLTHLGLSGCKFTDAKDGKKAYGSLDKLLGSLPKLKWINIYDLEDQNKKTFLTRAMLDKLKQKYPKVEITYELISNIELSKF